MTVIPFTLKALSSCCCVFVTTSLLVARYKKAVAETVLENKGELTQNEQRLRSDWL